MAELNPWQTLEAYAVSSTEFSTRRAPVMSLFPHGVSTW